LPCDVERQAFRPRCKLPGPAACGRGCRRAEFTGRAASSNGSGPMAGGPVRASRKRTLLILAGLLVLLGGVAVWVCWPVDLGIPLPADLASLDARLKQQIELGCENVRRAPEIPETWAELGMVYQGNGMPDLAILCYGRALAIKEAEPQWWYYTAMAEIELGNVQKSLMLLDRVAELQPDFAPAYWRRGLIYLDRSDFEHAEAAFRRAIEVDPTDGAGWRGLARALLQLDKHEEVIQLMQQWLSSGVRDKYAHRLLGMAYQQAGQLELAKQELDESGKVKPAWQDLWMYEVVQYGSNPGVLMKEARHCIENQDYRRAIAILEPLSERQSEDISILNTLAMSYVQIEAYDSAIRVAGKSAHLQPKHYEAHLVLATAYHRSRRYDLAWKSVDRALECNPSSGDACEIKGLLLDMRGKPEEAIAMFRRAEQCEPNDPRYQYQIAMVHCRAKQWDQGAAVLEPVVEKYPTFVPGLLGLALAYIELRKFDAAQELLVKAARREPRNPSLEHAARRMKQLKAP